MSEIVIYSSEDNQARVDVRFEDETVWLNRHQLASLFDRDIKTIGKHINKIFFEGELDEHSVVAKFATTASDGKTYDVSYYNLDLIISVGYRVNSKRGTQFRQWATKRLRDYLVDGYAVNNKRILERDLEIKHLKNGISILRRSIEEQAQSLTDASNLAALLDRFSLGLSLLDDYDHDTLDVAGKTKREAAKIEPQQYRSLIEKMRSDFSSALFGKEKDKGFESSVNQIYQTFGGTEQYSTLEEKAAMLLYLIVKNHSFVDGNKRIAAACFVYFLRQNNMLFKNNNQSIITSEALAALTLFIAVSKPEEIQTVKQVVMSILNRGSDK